MKLVADQDTYSPAQPIGILVKVEVDYSTKKHSSNRIRLVMATERQMVDLMKDPRHDSSGETAFYFPVPGPRGIADRILVSPKPKRPGRLILLYHPPLVEDK